MLWIKLKTLFGILAATVAIADEPLSLFADGSDLGFYVTRPELRPPLWNVTLYQPDKVTPGYWFVAPYTQWTSPPVRNEYQPCQAGPTIYDGAGNLVWSGACLYNNRNCFDFKANNFSGSPHLSFVLGRGPTEVPDSKGLAMVFDKSYEKVKTLTAPRDFWEFNLHEFNIVDEGKTGLIIATHAQIRNISELANINRERGNLRHDTIQEVDLASGKVNFEWFPLDKGLSMSEVVIPPPSDLAVGSAPWDFFHMNSVDKNQDGDYLVSGRYTNAIYKVSHKDGSIMWRLGGLKNDFIKDFNFSSQHHARFISSNETVTILSFFDNASDDHRRQKNTSPTSSAKIVALYVSEEPPRAKLLRQVNRPDGELTRKRGSVEIMPDSNIFICWSEQGYMSEHSADGQLLFEARFKSPRFSTYRASKFNFTGVPTEPPVLKTFPLTNDAADNDVPGSEAVSISYVSWNGATEVKSWNFYGLKEGQNTFLLLGNAKKLGFETTFVSHGPIVSTFAEAIGADGKSLGKSPIVASVASDELDSFHNTIISTTSTNTGDQYEDSGVYFVTSVELGLGTLAVILLTVSVLGLIVVGYLTWTRRSQRTHQYQSLSNAKSPLTNEMDYD